MRDPLEEWSDFAPRVAEIAKRISDLAHGTRRTTWSGRLKNLEGEKLEEVLRFVTYVRTVGKITSYRGSFAGGLLGGTWEIGCQYAKRVVVDFTFDPVTGHPTDFSFTIDAELINVGDGYHHICMDLETYCRENAVRDDPVAGFP